MLEDFLKSQAALYACGAMTANEREQFELILEFHDELHAFTAELREVGATVLLAAPRAMNAAPSPALRQRLQNLISTHPQQHTPDGLVMSGADGLVRWINSAFTDLCGYTVEEVQGKKLGPILQGPLTNPETAGRIRSAVKQYRPCCETILNYHKNGTPYWVEIAITPIFDDQQAPRWLVAREKVVADPVAA